MTKTESKGSTWDIFISHASEDKNTFVRPLAVALRSHGLRVWYDEFSLTPGDSLRRSIEHGLANSKFGIVVVSPSFAGKPWTERELSALYAQLDGGDAKRIVPIWHDIDLQAIRRKFPFLADILALNSSTQTLLEIVERILILSHTERSVDISKKLPTGILALDAMLGGGLPRPSTLTLTGKKGVGKSTLATQIQIASLFRGEPCIYISYREPPFDIIARFKRLNAPIEDFIANGHLRILDNFSVINSLSREDVDSYIGNPLLSSGILRIENPEDPRIYFSEQLRLWDEMGTGGINVVDSVNERYAMIDTSDKQHHFMRFRARVKVKNQSAIHIITETPEHESYNQAIVDIQGGAIAMFVTVEKGIQQRKIRLDFMRDGTHMPFERNFSITDTGIDIF
jgi:KaiC/GvpD/RAD55 family RecA-like ATPase